MQLKKELVYREFVQRENNLLRAPYNPEVSFYAAIKEGDVAKVEQLCQESLLDKEGLGTLSDHYLQNIKYHYVITTAIIARYCIEGGMELSNAYSLSDFYIQKADRCKTPEEVAALHPAMCMDYTKRMRNLRKSKISSLHIAVCLDYIYDHLHTHITAEQLAKLTGLNISYLSRLFKRKPVRQSATIFVIKKLKQQKICYFILISRLLKLPQFWHSPARVILQKYFERQLESLQENIRNLFYEQLPLENNTTTICAYLVLY